jgi:3D (Asp-Asp-Asp) domain-containing protein
MMVGAPSVVKTQDKRQKEHVKTVKTTQSTQTTYKPYRFITEPSGYSLREKLEKMKQEQERKQREEAAKREKIRQAEQAKKAAAATTRQAQAVKNPQTTQTVKQQPQQPNNANIRRDSRGNSGPKRLMMEFTAYTAGYESTQKKKGEAGYGITASGTRVQEGRTLACGKNLPFGTRIEAPSLDISGVCEDRGGAIGPNEVDVYFDDLNDALEFGRKRAEAIIYLNE